MAIDPLLSGIGLICRVGVGSVLGWAGYVKLRQPGDFAHVLERLLRFSPRLSRPLAQLLPSLELAVGIMLIAGLLTALVAGMAIALFVVFTVSLIIHLRHERQLNCFCFGTRHHRAGSRSWPILRNIGLMLMAVIAAGVPASSWSIDTQLGIAADGQLALLASSALGIGFTAIAVAPLMGRRRRRGRPTIDAGQRV